MHLERSLDSLPIGRRDPRRGRGIHALQARVQRRPAELARLRVELVAQRRVRARQAREPLAQRAQIEQRAPDEQRQPAAGGDVAHGGGRVASESARRVRLARLEDVDQMVRQPARVQRRDGFAVPMSRPR